MIDTTSRTGKLIMGILALIAEFENDIRRERQMDGIAKAKEKGTRFGRKPELTPERIAEIRALRADGTTVRSSAGWASARQRCIARWGIPSNLLADRVCSFSTPPQRESLLLRGRGASSVFFCYPRGVPLGVSGASCRVHTALAPCPW